MNQSESPPGRQDEATDLERLRHRLLALPEPASTPPAQTWRYREHGFAAAEAEFLCAHIDTLGDGVSNDDDNIRIYIHAYRLITELLGLEAMPFLLEELLLDLEESLGVLSTEVAFGLLLPLGGRVVPTLLAVVEDQEAPDFLRANFSEALKGFAQEGIARDAIIASFTEVMERDSEDPDILGFLAGFLAMDLDVTEAYPAIRAAYQANRVNPQISGDLEEIEIALGIRTERSTPPPNYNHLWNPPRPAATSAKAGRNDPCPCGSGRKYKKCCLGREA